MVVPFGCRSIPRTASCFDEARVGFAVWLGATVSDAVFDLAVLRFVLVGLVARGLLMGFEGFGFALLVAIWLSLCRRQHQVLPLTQAPRPAGIGKDRPKAYASESLFSNEVASCSRPAS